MGDKDDLKSDRSARTLCLIASGLITITITSLVSEGDPDPGFILILAIALALAVLSLSSRFRPVCGSVAAISCFAFGAIGVMSLMLYGLSLAAAGVLLAVAMGLTSSEKAGSGPVSN